MFGLRSSQHWTFTGFLVVLLQPIVLYLLAALVFTESGSDNALNLHADRPVSTAALFRSYSRASRTAAQLRPLGWKGRRSR